jgi:Bacteriophage head to tail connecting protein
MKSVNDVVARFHELEGEKFPWLLHYQVLAEIFLTRKMDFTRIIIPGQFLQQDVFDNTGQFSAYLFASVFLSMMWPDASRTFEICPDHRLKHLPGVEDYFRFCTRVMHHAMEKPKAGLSMALMEHFLDSGIFGTSGIFTDEGLDDEPEIPLRYDAWGVKNMCIAETAQGYVNEVHFVRPLSVRQIMEEYSRPGDTLPSSIQEKIRAGGQALEEKLDVLTAIMPKNPEAGKHGIAGMPVRSVHIIVDNRAKLRESGFDEMPVAVGRMFKQLNESLGRSCGMLALPDAQSLNILTEGVLIATEKSLDPPLGVLDDGRLGGGVIDTSARAINVFNTAGRGGNDKPIFPLTTMDLAGFQFTQKLQEFLASKIAQAFFLDRLLDLNNQTQMTAYETSVRDKIRGEALGGVFARQEKEVLTPMVERSFNILFRKGYLGIVKDGPGARLRKRWDAIVGAEKVIIPDAVLKAHRAGLSVFEVKYISPAKRFQQAEKLKGLMQANDIVMNMAQLPAFASMADSVDIDENVHKIYELSGAPIEVLRTLQQLKDFRAANKKQRDAQTNLDQGEQKANIGLKTAQARQATGTTAALPPIGGNG